MRADDVYFLRRWDLYKKCEITNEIQKILLDEEKIVLSCKSVNDSNIIIFTNKRIIGRNDIESAINREIMTIPYSSILMYSTEKHIWNKEKGEEEIKLWTASGIISISIDNMFEENAVNINKILAKYII